MEDKDFYLRYGKISKTKYTLFTLAKRNTVRIHRRNIYLEKVWEEKQETNTDFSVSLYILLSF